MPWESNNVSDIRDKIKTFLASQGMIKGHSGSSSRTSQNPPQETPPEPATLKLANEGYPSSASESPPSNLLVLNDDVRHSQVSSVRDEGWTTYPPPPLPNGYPLLRHSPQPGPRQETTPPPPPPFHQNEPVYDPFLMQQQQPSSNNTLPSSWTSQPPPGAPIYRSSYGSLYTDDIDMDGAVVPYNLDGTSGLQLPSFITGRGATDELIQHYGAQVLEKQYLLADDPIMKIMLNAIQSGFARSSAQLLALVHYNRTKTHMITQGDIQQRYQQLSEVLSKEQHSDNDAIGALTVVSSFLFSGGMGEWKPWLNLSVEHSRRILHNSRYHNVKDALINCNNTERFIVKTTLWFDVLASVTTLQVPRLLDVINYLFDPSSTSALHEVQEHDAQESEALSMMNIMGAEGRVIWAFAQISNLARNKTSMSNRGVLDLTVLVRRVDEIDRVLQVPSSTIDPCADNVHRQLVSEVFRNAARLYLLTVLHGDFPNVPAVHNAVEATLKALMDARNHPDHKVQHTVARSTVVAVFMCGCLARTKEEKDRTMTILTDENDWGNAKGVRSVIEQVWNTRNILPAREPVPWRQTLHDNGLLLV
ncbi:hypothetical protein VNI00_004963 [Paramarasmius palmivorus]|uniref:Uncharacterized protein n=1 Tax=Paramarasmius palmivorus TaxID=297713 RepID=A0AAW0DHA9_9AGAR